jgi:hypothetical protein
MFYRIVNAILINYYSEFTEKKLDCINCILWMKQRRIISKCKQHRASSISYEEMQHGRQVAKMPFLKGKTFFWTFAFFLPFF